MKVAIYCRLSEEDRNKQFETDDSNSIQNQKAMLLQYAMEQGWYKVNTAACPIRQSKISHAQKSNGIVSRGRMSRLLTENFGTEYKR